MKKILLTQNRFTLVDDEDFEKLNKYNWCVSSGYAVGGTNRNGHFKMHRIILGVKRGQEVDHIDGNRLNNQKSNLRIASRTQNQMNRKIQINNHSGFKGVSWCKRTKKWLVQIRVKTKTIFLGYFEERIDAANVYNETAKRFFGQYAKLNKI
jgi:hypothetical protein